VGYKAKVSVMAAMAAGRRKVDGGNLKAAIRCFDKAVALDPLAAQAYLYRAGLKLLVGDQAGALDDFDAIARLDHSHLPAYRDLTTLSAEEFPGLIAACEKALKARPRCAWGHVFHSFSLRSLMRYEDAVRDLDRAVACDPRSAALRAMRSRVKLTNRQDFYDGVRDMEKAVSLAPDWGWLNCWLGEALRHQGEFRRALKALDRGLAVDPRYLRGWAWRGGVKVALGDARGAIADLTRSLAFDPIYHYDFEYTADQKSWALNQRMRARRLLGDVAGALRDLNLAHRYGPRYAWSYDPKGGEKELRASLRELDRKPSLPWARAWRGYTLARAGRFDEALRDYDFALARSPRLAWAWAWKGSALASLSETADSERCLTKAVKLDPAYAPAFGWRGEARRLLGRLDDAAADFTKAIKLDHRSAWAYAGRGECRQKQGDLARSLADLDRALAILPGYAEALGWRAETLRLLGRTKDALKDADAALKAKPGLVLVYVTRALIKQARKDFRGQLADFRLAAKLDPSVLEATRA